MGLVNSILDALADKIERRIQGRTVDSHGDVADKGSSYSVEAEVCESLTSLMLTDFTLPIEGDSERAMWLDNVSSDFVRDSASALVSLAFETGDAVVVPIYNGVGFDNVVVGAGDFEILSATGPRIDAMVYVVDTRRMDDGTKLQLLQLVELVDYVDPTGSKRSATRYRLYAAVNDMLSSKEPGALVSEWGDYETEWSVPNVDRLLVARFKSFTVDPRNPNSAKGVPICFGASEPIREIRYLLRQMHVEFGLSEKAIMADKRLFQRSFVKGKDGKDVPITELPKGRERLFISTRTIERDAEQIHDWSPEIRYEAYLAALDKQEQLVEKAVGVSSGVISTPNDTNYENVDNVRKSQQKTIGFIKSARRSAEACLQDLVYAWDALANYYGTTPTGQYDIKFDWSDDYVNTFSDYRLALISGETIGATDAVDYRMFVFGEPQEVAKERVAEIKAAKGARTSVMTVGDLGVVRAEG